MSIPPRLSPHHEARTKRISELLPIVSLWRYSPDRDLRRKGVLLQNVLRDLERLNDIELLLGRALEGVIQVAELEDLLHRP